MVTLPRKSASLYITFLPVNSDTNVIKSFIGTFLKFTV